MYDQDWTNPSLKEFELFLPHSSWREQKKQAE